MESWKFSLWSAVHIPRAEPLARQWTDVNGDAPRDRQPPQLPAGTRML